MSNFSGSGQNYGLNRGRGKEFETKINIFLSV
jgi:hypothetical protein